MHARRPGGIYGSGGIGDTPIAHVLSVIFNLVTDNVEWMFDTPIVAVPDMSVMLVNGASPTLFTGIVNNQDGTSVVAVEYFNTPIDGDPWSIVSVAQIQFINGATVTGSGGVQSRGP